MRWNAYLGGLLTATAVALSALPVQAQGEYVPTGPPLWNPLYHDRPETGGFYTSAQFLVMSLSRHVDAQQIATRGFVQTNNDLGPNGTIIQNLTFTNPITGGILTTPTGQVVVAPTQIINPNRELPGVPGAYVGSGTPALFADDLGRHSMTPGFGIAIGYRTSSGVTFEASYKHLFGVKYSGSATLAVPNFGYGNSAADTFLTAPVSNFPVDYAGPEQLTSDGNQQPGPLNSSNTFGVWNAATSMQVQLTQRYDQVDLTARIPVYQDDHMRTYLLAGGRFAWIWERFKWRTVKEGFNIVQQLETTRDFLREDGLPPEATGRVVFFPVSGPQGQGGNFQNDGIIANPFPIIVTRAVPTPVFVADAAIYTNIVSNRMYGPVVGYGCDYYLGRNFAVSADVAGSLMVDIVKTRAKYERNDFSTQARAVRTFYEFVPHASTSINLWWYPIEGVQVKLGYQALGFFNTIAAKNPVDFNFGTLDPKYDHQAFRLLHGLDVGVGFTF